MNRKVLLATLFLGLPVLLACGLTNTVTEAVTGGDSFKPATALWSDVPPMSGLTPSELEDLPLPVKLLMRTMIGNLGRLNAEGEDQTTGNVDWISYNSSGTPDDVESFYTPELMAGNGWAAEGSEACTGGSASGLAESGTLCTFSKTEGGEDILLAIIATQEEAGKPTGVFFLRLEVPADSTNP